ncbi:hypothetical protein F5Y12DRAFT_784836 [Xylaria sp. FL1777]|nr:hypothetical protein F5Y12DRAFT_784836 [Xylaria sp. FL1777]
MATEILNPWRPTLRRIGDERAGIARSQLPHPDLSLPVPKLSYDFRMSVELNPKVGVGIVPSRPSGQDSMVIDPETYAVKLETIYFLKTNDADTAYIEVRTRGFRTGHKDVLGTLQNPIRAGTVNPSMYAFRLVVRMETGDPRYSTTVNQGVWVFGSGLRKDAEVIYEQVYLSKRG